VSTGWRRLCAGDVYRSLVEHWDGDRWTVVRLPRLSGPGNGLSAVDTAASGAVWAVGGSARARGPSQPLVLRLGGRSWSSVPAPASPHSAALNGVGAWGRGAAWVVGATSSGGGPEVVERSDPGIPGYDGRLMALAGFAGGELWAVGSASRGAGPERVLILPRCASSPS